MCGFGLDFDLDKVVVKGNLGNLNMIRYQVVLKNCKFFQVLYYFGYVEKYFFLGCKFKYLRVECYDISNFLKNILV